LWCLIECMKMKLKKIQKKLSAYLDGELDKKQAKEIEYYINHYPELRSEYCRLQKINDLLDSHQHTISDPFFMTRLKTLLQQEQHVKSVLLKRFNWVVKLLIPATVVAGLFVGMLLGMAIQERIHKTDNSVKNEIAREYFGSKVLSSIPEGSITETYIKLSSQVK